ncbi:MAG: radical SAM family heme chaperone HemW [Polyangiaceae bacterium]
MLPQIDDQAAPSGLVAPAVAPPPSGVYVHFPWCLKKCPYCDFVSFAADRATIDHRGYADAVLAEMDQRRVTLEGRRIATIFVGGGTPSLWEPAELGRVLDRIRQVCAVERDAEVTVECNPTSLDEARARALKAVGVNRLSIGVQGLSRSRLEFLGRLHDETGGLIAVRQALSSGIDRVSADLIFGVAGGAAESAAEAADEVGRVADTGVTHVSAYALTIEPSTVFGELARKGTLPILPDDAVAEAFNAVRDALESRGFVHYEVSNYARPGHEARHNLGYWRGHDYVGLGCAAYGTISVDGGGDAAGRESDSGRGGGAGRGARRYRNKTDPAKYMAAAIDGSKEPRRGPNRRNVNAGVRATTEGSSEDLDAETRLRERIMLGLRIAEGLDLEAAAAELGVTGWTKERRRAADRLAKQGRIVIDGGRVTVPREARLFTDGIAVELF